MDLVDSTSVSWSYSQNVYEEEFPYEVLGLNEIVDYMIRIIKEVNTVFKIPVTSTRLLLHHFKWDKEKLLERYYDGNPDKLFDEAHIANPFNKHKSIRSLVKEHYKYNDPCSMNNNSAICEICLLQIPNDHMVGLGCGHKFCLSCWSEYLTNKILDEGIGLTMTCAAHKCETLVDDGTVITLVKDPRVRLKYKHLIANSFVECNRLLRWCPAPDCIYAIKVQYVDIRCVRCACGHNFCFNCGENWHDPVRCSWFRKWIKKCDDDSATSNWISANTKECPKCKAVIEKDGGCNHMVCKNKSCKTDFCWVCLGPWEPHGSSWYSCNKYDEDEAKKSRDSQENSRAALHRYLFYCNRYMNHMQSLKFEHKLYAAIQNKMSEMQQILDMSWIEVQFLKKAVDALCQCRQTLMYTYVFSYYLKKNNQSIIFEDNQKDLEGATEKLSEYLERNLRRDEQAEIKQKVQDKYRYCESRRKILLEHVHEGYEKDLWDYIE